MPSVAGRGKGSKASVLRKISEALCPSMTSSRLLNTSESVSNPPMLLGASGSDSLLLEACMVQ